MNRILLIQTAFTGDVVLATPVAEKLHRYYPEAEIDFLVRRGNESLFTGHPFIHEVLVFDKKKDKWKNLFRLAKKIRGRKYDLVVNMHRFGSSGFLTAVSGAKERLGFEKNPWSWAFTRKFPHEIGTGKHEVKRNLDLVAHLTDSYTERPHLYPTEADRLHVSYHTGKGDYVCMAPASVWFTKQWPAQKWVGLIKEIPAEMRIYLLGAPGDQKLCDEIRRAVNRNNIVNLCGQLTFLQSIALMEKAKMNFVNDSAPLHFASSVNAPVTAIFCSTIPAFGFGPLSEKAVIIETDVALKCKPCGLHGHSQCPELHFKCALTIDPKRVAALAFPQFESDTK
ncbi:MAG TPA: glycosyltransferase family 9 protein [Bacteroidia bacterium]|nr:glycosyltransferase family 9 protein [Bacteroidia bacterium]